MHKPMQFIRVASLFFVSLSFPSLWGCQKGDESPSANGDFGGSTVGAAQGGTSGAAGSANQGGTGALGGVAAGIDAGVGGNGGNVGAAGGSMAGAAGGIAGSATAACDAPNVCDGFETYVADTGFGPWKQNGTGGTLKIDETHVFAGQKAVQIVSKPGGGQRVQLQRMGAPLFPAVNNKFWGRVMAWASSLPGKSDKEDKNVHYDLVQASGTGAGEYRVAGMGGVLLNYEPHDCYYGTNKPIPQSRWACWEWLYDGSTNTIEFYIDQQLQARMVNKGQGCVDGTDSVWAAPMFNQLRIGFVNYQSKAETTTLWLDEFAAGPARQGCPKETGATH